MSFAGEIEQNWVLQTYLQHLNILYKTWAACFFFLHSFIIICVRFSSTIWELQPFQTWVCFMKIESPKTYSRAISSVSNFHTTGRKSIHRSMPFVPEKWAKTLAPECWVPVCVCVCFRCCEGCAMPATICKPCSPLSHDKFYFALRDFVTHFGTTSADVAFIVSQC